MEYTLVTRGRTVLIHTEAEPFAAALRKTTEYAVRRGTVSARETVSETVLLRDGELLENGLRLFAGAADRPGCSLTLRFTELDAGMRIDMEGTEGYAWQFTFPADLSAGVFGGGEQYRKLNLSGHKITNLVSEHITLPTILKKGLLPAPLAGLREPEDIGSYAPIPTYVFGDGSLLSFDVDTGGTADFTGPRPVFTFDACPRSVTFLFARRFRDLLKEQNKLRPNRQFLPDWAMGGMILAVQGGTDRILEMAFRAQDAGMPVAGIWSQDWCGCKKTVMGYQVNWNWEADQALYPELAAAIRKLQERGIRFLAYLNPYLVKDGPLYRYAKQKGYLITHPDGSIYHMKSTTFEAGMLDLTNPEAARYIKETLIQKNMLDLGVKGYMADFGEYLPLDCVLHSGDPAVLHNQWPVLWAKLNREATTEYGDPDVFFFTRSGYRGIEEYAPILWNGDQHVDFSKDYGMPCILPATFSLGFSGVPLVHADCGGFFSFLRMSRSDELLRRWLELSAFSVCMRSHEGIQPGRNAQPYDERILPEAARFARMHQALLPYLKHVLREAQAGVPALRPDFFETGDLEQHYDDYSYYLGQDLFVAPVVTAHTKKRTVYLPEGTWIHLLTGERYSAGFHKVPAPIGSPAVFYREGSAFTSTFLACRAAGRP